MKRQYGLDQIEREADAFVTVGTFDGVHVGHQAILRYLVHRARQNGGHSVVVTFDPHPREVLSGEPMPLLTTVEERARVLEDLGVERFIVLPFTLAFSKMPPEDFVEKILVERIGLQEIVIGYDHGFGRGRRGDSSLLEALGERLGFTVDVIPAQVVEEHVVSSSEIRRLLGEAGAVGKAAEMLGRRYALSGTVVRGDGRGKGIGFPTANIKVDHPRKFVPLQGVYAVQVHLEGRTWGGMMNIGLRPTFGGTREVIEVHIFDLEQDLYGRQLRVEFVERIRDEQKFGSVDELVEQLSKDQQRCKRALAALA